MTMVPFRTRLSRVGASFFGLLSSAWRKAFSRTEEHAAARRLTGAVDPPPGPGSGASEAEGESKSMPVSLDLLAEQMLTMVDVVSAQEKEIQFLKDRCQALEEHEQAIMVAFTTFFHVLAAGKVARIEDISAILENITGIAEREERPPEAIRFLRELAGMLRDQSPRIDHEPGQKGPGAYT